MREISYSEAIKEAITEEMERDPNVFMMGEDIGVYGGAFQVSKGLIEKFGKERIRNTPISEAGFVGTAIGAASLGMRPIVEIQFMDFCTLIMDQLLNHATKFHYIYCGQINVPIVIRTPGGGGRGYGATHSQSLESLFLNIPGLKIAVPSTPSDAKGLLKTSVRDNNPVLFVENKLLYGIRGHVPEEEFLIPFGEALKRKDGPDATIITYSRMVKEALQAVELLAEDEILVDLIDLRTLVPLDMETIGESVKKTGRVLIVEEGIKTGGVGAEIGMRITEELFAYLNAPVKRIAAKDIPIPCSPILENATLPTSDDIYAGVIELIENFKKEVKSYA